MAFTLYSDVSALINTIYDQALTVARENAVLNRTVLNFGDRTGLTPRSVTQYGTATFQQVGEADDVVAQNFSRALLSTVTPTEYAASFMLTDSRIESDPDNVRMDAATELGIAIAQQIDVSIADLYDTFTGGTVGAAGTTLNWGHFFSALAILQNNHAPAPYVCALHPYAWLDLANAVTPAAASQTNSPQFQDDVMRRYIPMSVAGVDIVITSNIAVDGSTDVYGAMYSRQAVALDMRRAPRLEPQRDASRRAWELNMSAVYAAGLWRPTYGVTIVSDATTPA